jgi:hypothetical protein
MTTQVDGRGRPEATTGGRWLMLTVLLAGQFMALLEARRCS